MPRSPPCARPRPGGPWSTKYNCACSMNQDLAQVTVTALAYCTELRLTTGRTLVRQQPQPGGELSSLAEGCAVADRRYDRGCNQRSDSWDLTQSATRIIARSNPFHFAVHFVDLYFQILPLTPQHGNQVPHPRGEVLVDVFKHLGYGFPQSARLLGEHDTPLQQEPTNLVDESSSARDEPLTHAMQRLAQKS